MSSKKNLLSSGRRILAFSFALQLLSGIRVARAASPPVPSNSDEQLSEMSLEELMSVQVRPFEVSTKKDVGYRASNAVSGSRFDVPIKDLPFAIQAFTEAFIADQKPVNLFDVARYSPSVTYRSNDFNEGNANLAIRGFAVGSLAGGNIQTLRDGFHGPSIVDFTNIARVEIVKGPSSFLYGQVAPGGIVNIITKSPQREFSTRAEARYGSYDEYRLETDATGPIGNTLSYRLSTAYDQDMHYWRPYDAHSRDIAPSLLWEPTRQISVTLKYENFIKLETPQLMQKPAYGRERGAVPTQDDPNRDGEPVPGLSDNWNSMSNSDYRRSETGGINSSVDIHAARHWNVRTSFSHQKYAVDAVASGNFGMANNATLMQGRRVRGQTYTNWDDSFEIQSLGKFRVSSISLRLLLGVEYVFRRFETWAAQLPNNPALGSNPTASPYPLWDLRDSGTWDRDTTYSHSALTENAFSQSVRYRDKSAYIGTTFGFFDEKLLALAGFRLTSTESEVSNLLTRQSQPWIAATAITPQYGLLYKISPEVTAFASYAESFVPGTNLLTNLDGTRSMPKPTEGKGYDVGFKTDLLGGRISGTVTAFDVENNNIVNDLATTDSTGSVVIYNVQSGRQRSRGLEFDSTVTPIENWQFYVSYSYMDARILQVGLHDAAILAQNPSTLDAAGRSNYATVSLLHNARLQMSAPHLANLWTRYDFTQGDLNGVYVAGGFNYVYDQTILPDGPPSTRQTYLLLNALLGRTWGTKYLFDTSLMLKNAADVHYRPSQSTRSRPRELLFSLAIKLL